MNINEAINKIKHIQRTEDKMVYMRRITDSTRKYMYSYGDLYSYNNVFHQYFVESINKKVTKLHINSVLADDWEVVE